MCAHEHEAALINNSDGTYYTDQEHSTSAMLDTVYKNKEHLSPCHFHNDNLL